MTCITKDCGKDEVTRGLCGTCYTTLRKLIKCGKVNEDDMLRTGKILAIRSKPRKASKRMSWFLDKSPQPA